MPEEWHYERNDAAGLTPDNVLSGSQRTAWWHCRRDHGPYEMVIKFRTNGRYCKECSKEDAATKRLASLNQKRRTQHMYAARGRARLVSEQNRPDEGDGDLFSEHSID